MAYVFWEAQGFIKSKPIIMKKYLLIVIAVLFSLQGLAQVSNNGDLTICWDNSLSMAQRDIEKDLLVLQDYFEENQNVKVQLIYFNNDVTLKEYLISKGDWNELKSDLIATNYDGATFYGKFTGMIKHPNVYVFTDGIKLLDRDNLILPDNSFIINSNPEGNSIFLERTALLNRATLVSVSDTTHRSDLAGSLLNVENQEMGLLKGAVYIDNKPATGAKIAVKGVSDSFLTDAGGSFSIKAEVGDTLLVTSVESRTVKMLPIEKISYTSVFLESNIVELDEVILVEKRQEEELELINTGYSTSNKNRLGYSVATVGSDEISSIETNAGDALRNKVAGVNIDSKGYTGAEGGLAQTNIRGKNSLFLDQNTLVVIDGIPTGRGSGIDNVPWEISGAAVGNLNHIDPSNIEKITVLKGLAATNQWGSEGANGVILITTKTGGGASGNKGSNKKEDRARLKNNIYEESQVGNRENDSPIIKALSSTTEIEEAYDTYLTLRNYNSEDPTFYLDAFSYFQNRDKKLASRIISNLWESNPESVEVLRTVAMALATVDDYDSQIRVNEELMAKIPNDVNAHLNNAIALGESGSPQKGLDELIAMETGNKYTSLNTSGISKTLNREIKNLLFRHTGKVNVSNVDSKYQGNLKYKARLVFEWNLPGAEFELQFVNPQNRFFEWRHTSGELGERMRNEIRDNYRLEEFEFAGDVLGKWVFNAQSLEDFSDKTAVPLLLKCTIYTNFGYPNQQKEEILLHFSKNGEKRMIKTLFVN